VDQPAVRQSAEFARIAALPRRILAKDAPRTPELRTAAGIAAGVSLRWIQAWALAELFWCRGLFGAIPVGAGKTLISWLAAVVLSARRPHLFIPASLVDKTRKEFDQLSRHWISPQPAPMIHTYTELTLEKNVRLLDTLRPDLLIFDEADKLRDTDRSAAKRVHRYVWEHAAECAVVVMTGTILRKSLEDFAHLMGWALKRGAPVPLTPDDLFQWCQALDEDDKVGMGRWRPGALLQLPARVIGNDPEFVGSDLACARSAVRRRIEETPGILITDESECDQPIHVRFIEPPEDPLIDKAFFDYRSTEETLDGWPMTDALSRFNYESQLGCGFYYMWDPRPPAYWLAARKAVAKFIREAIRNSQHSSHPLDTEAAVLRAYPDAQAVTDWLIAKAREPVFEPNSVPVWLSGSVMYRAADWSNTDKPGLIWCKHATVAQGIASVTGLPYYGAKGRRVDSYGRATGESIETITKADRTLILSLDANLRGRNLQHYSRNLTIGWEQAANRVEQQIGRTHRAGQEQPVTFDVLLTSGLTADSFAKTLAEARFVRQLHGHTQKILKSQIQRLHRYPIGPRWLRAGIE